MHLEMWEYAQRELNAARGVTLIAPCLSIMFILPIAQQSRNSSLEICLTFKKEGTLFDFHGLRIKLATVERLRIV